MERSYEECSCFCCSGRADSADLWLTTLGFSIPAGIHSADFILDLASGSLTAESLSDERYRQYCQFCLACARDFASESGCKAFDSTLVPLVEGIAAALSQQVTLSITCLFSAIKTCRSETAA